MGTIPIKAMVARRDLIATDVLQLELTAPPPHLLEPFEAGAHIDLHLGNGLVRSYSLVNPGPAPASYRIAVQRDARSRGGSSWIFDELQAGHSIEITGPRNSFRLVDDGKPIVLIAGGIGITPLWSMAQRLRDTAVPWKLYFAARSRDRAAFLDEISALEAATPGSVVLHFDDQHDFQPIDLRWPVAAALPDSHLYCCGPAPMLASFEALTQDRDPALVHIERFTAAEAPALEGGFEVVLARSRRTLAIARGQSILDALLQSGLTIPFACTEGVCGECLTKVLEGEPLHRDSYLTEDERASNSLITVCCSGSKGPRLVLDL